jgi:sugar lactone lactonase YvrE
MRQLKTVICLASLLLLPAAARAQQGVINTFAGGGPNNLPAIAANVPYPLAVATDGAGNYYFTTFNTNDSNRVFKVDTTGTLTVFAGTGFAGDSGDNGPATQAELDGPEGIAADSAGNVYIADTNNCVVRKVDKNGIITTIAGTKLANPQGVAVDSSGNLYIADSGNSHIVEVTAEGSIQTVAGNGFCESGGAACGDGGSALNAGIGNVFSLAVDGAAPPNVYIADLSNNEVRKFSVGGNITSVVGPGSVCGGGTCGDGGPASGAQLDDPLAVAADSAGNIFISDNFGSRIREVPVANGNLYTSAGYTATIAGYIYTVAGGNNCPNPWMGCGDGGAATSAGLSEVSGLAVDGSGNIFMADFPSLAIREVTASNGIINTVAGNASLYYAGNGVAAGGASLNQPAGVAFDSSGNSYIADQSNNIVRKVDLTGNITTIAGIPGHRGYNGEGIAATSAWLRGPTKVAVYQGNLYIADTQNCVVRMVDPSGNISTFAGRASSDTEDEYCGYSGDGGLATNATLSGPAGIAVDSSGNVYIADTGNHVVREVSGGTINTIAGYCTPDPISGCDSTAGYSGDSGPATSATLNYPNDVALDAAGNLYIADTNNCVIRQVNTKGIITTFAGNSICAFSSDGPATLVSLSNPEGVAVDALGEVLIGDSGNNLVRLVDGQGFMHTVAGNNTYGFSGDGGPGTSAELANPWGVGTDPSGNIYIADSYNYRVRVVNALAALSASTTNLTFGSQAKGTSSDPQSVTLAAVGPLTISSIAPTGDFSESDDCPINTTLAGSCAVNITFKPTGAGTRTGNITISDNGYFSTSLVISLQGTGTAQASQSITFPNPGTQTYGEAPITLTASATSNLTVTYQVISGPASVSGSTLTINGAGQVTVEADQTGNAQYAAATPVQDTFTVNKATATVTLSNLTQTYTGSALTPTATTNPPGLGIGWTNAPQTNAGSYSVTATVSDNNYQGSQNGTFIIQRATATVALSNLTQTYTGSALSPTATTVPSGLSVAWTGAPDTKVGSYKVTATVNNPNYSSNTASGNFVIQPATPVINWPTPTPITYGTALSSAQLDATATSSGVAVNGAYAYTPPAGTVLNAGSQPLNVTFTPSDGADFKKANGSVTLTVNKATPVITWANPAAITYGTPLGPQQLDATASVPGTFVYTPKPGTVLGVGVQTLSVLFTPGPSGPPPPPGPPGPPNGGNYTTATKTVSITVNPAMLTVTATNISVKHNQAIPPLTYTVTGYVNGDNKSVLSGSPNESTTGKQGSPVGSYPITITQGTLKAANYTFKCVNGTLTITP